MLAVASTGSSGRPPYDLAELIATGAWALDTKLDGIRAMYDNLTGTLRNRKGADITAKFPEVMPALHRQPWSLDGEIVAEDSRFETTLYRESLENPVLIGRAVIDRPVRFVAFDLPFSDRIWSWRRVALVEHAAAAGVDVTSIGTTMEFFERTRELGMEGVIAKRKDSHYLPGRRSTSWIKFKHLHRVSCLLAGYAPGNGSRAHFGALTLALINDEGRVVTVGKCGSGFTEQETHTLKARLDAGEILIAEIETVNYTSGGTLRFPVFRGLRTDIAPTDCTTDQLAALPRC